MCELDAMIYSDARRYNISLDQLNQLHKFYHEEHNDKQPKNLIDLLEGVLT